MGLRLQVLPGHSPRPQVSPDVLHVRLLVPGLHHPHHHLLRNHGLAMLLPPVYGGEPNLHRIVHVRGIPADYSGYTRLQAHKLSHCLLCR